MLENIRTISWAHSKQACACPIFIVANQTTTNFIDVGTRFAQALVSTYRPSNLSWGQRPTTTSAMLPPDRRRSGISAPVKVPNPAMQCLARNLESNRLHLALSQISGGARSTCPSRPNSPLYGKKRRPRGQDIVPRTTERKLDVTLHGGYCRYAGCTSRRLYWYIHQFA